MRGVGDEVTVRREDGTRKVEPFLDLQRDRTLLQDPSHLFRDSHEPAHQLLFSTEPDGR